MIRVLLNAYILLIILDAILSYVPTLQTHNWVLIIRRIVNYSLNPIRKYLPPHLPFDISPLVVIGILQLIMYLW